MLGGRAACGDDDNHDIQEGNTRCPTDLESGFLNAAHVTCTKIGLKIEKRKEIKFLCQYPIS